MLRYTASFDAVYGGLDPSNEVMWGDDWSDMSSDVSDQAGDEVLDMEVMDAQHPTGTLNGAPVTSVAVAAENVAMIALVCVATQPLVYAHLNGFSIIGAEMPSKSRAGGMLWAQSILALMGYTLTYAFMVGQ